MGHHSLTLGSLHCIYRAPLEKVEGPAPCLILLHGYGSHEQDLYSFERLLPKNAWVFSLRAPLDLAQGGHAWFSIDFEKPREDWSRVDEAKKSLQHLHDALLFLLRDWESPLQPPVLLGFSQGAILSCAFALQYPEWISGAALFSGYYLEELTPEPHPEAKNCPLWASHGAQDVVIPLSWPEKTYEDLKSKEVPVDFHVYSSMGHGIDPEAFASFSLWLHRILAST